MNHEERIAVTGLFIGAGLVTLAIWLPDIFWLGAIFTILSTLRIAQLGRRRESK